MSLMKVYLAGGMHSNWREKVKEAIPDAIYYDPTLTGFTDSWDYTRWDLQAIEDCDVIFIYMDRDNPSGFGLSLELGFAYAKDKTIILVEDLSIPVDDPEFRSKYFDMHRSLERLYSYETALYDGIKVLEELNKNRF